MNEENPNTPVKSVGNWVKNSVSLKLITIAILVMLLLIPSSMIESIIHERANLSEQAITEVSGKWAGDQLVNGPVLIVPIVYEYKSKKEEEPDEVIRYLHILPEDLNVSGTLNPEILKRGIYDVAVYESEMKVEGEFLLNQKVDRDHLKEIKWNDAHLAIGISDMRGIKDNIVVHWDKKRYKAEPGSRISNRTLSGVTVDLPDLFPKRGEAVKFNFGLKLKGSRNLSFIPLGNETKVDLESGWSSPSFNGNFLPDHREITEAGFTANWKILQLNRNFPQSWVGGYLSLNIQESAFGVDLFMPLDDYKKAIRSEKYAVMTIFLTFLIFFLVEVMNGKKIHPFQYTLVGLSLCLFYVLLISISEHSSFNKAYMISALATTAMITLYSRSIFKSAGSTALMSVTLIGVYCFLFVTLQLADYALLMGSVGLMLILSATMYFTRNINWYKLSTKTS
ncbi:MAG: cell envelope integrity protein CreD [Bacteroidota bacterium]